MNTVKAIIVLGLDGKRVLANYYNDQINPSQFDKKIFSKTKSHKTRDELLIEDDLMVLHRCVVDLHMYVVGGRNENPLILDRVLCCLAEVVSTLSSRNVESKSVFDHLDQIILAFDEICDGGVVLETDPSHVLQRVCLREGVAEQSMAQVLQSATEHIKFPWIRS